MQASIAKESMTKSLITVKWNSAMAEAYRVMEERRIRHLPVTDQEGFVIGIISDRDVNRAMNPKRPGFAEDCMVGDFMSWPAITVDERSPIKDIAEGMIDEKVSAFLVTKEGKQVVGIVTTEDLLRYLLGMLKEEKIKHSVRDLPYMPVVSEMIREMETAGI